MLKGFREFITRGNVLDLAVAVVIGGAFGQVINSFVADVLTPLIGFLGGVPDFSAYKLGPIAFGKFLNALLNFVVVALALYFFVVAPLQRLQSHKAQPEATAPPSPPEPSEEAKLLREILETLRQNRASP